MSTTTKKKSHHKAKKTEPVTTPVSNSSLSGKQKIPLNVENFELLKKFVTGEFPETYGEPFERIRVTPDHCPACRFLGGFDYAPGPVLNGHAHAGFDKEYFRQNRVVNVFCLSCGFRYKVTESWLIHFEVEKEVETQT